MNGTAWLVITIIVAVAIVWWAAKDHPLNHIDCRRYGCSFGSAETKMMTIGSSQPQKVRVQSCPHCGSTKTEVTNVA